ncbi:MAG: dTDP-4-amino-4,6-dideoxygalactose transaminase [Algoriphagus sp.]|jgi:dTDP-4-amino-4,6-dideoxygalactose transaminase
MCQALFILRAQNCEMERKQKIALSAPNIGEAEIRAVNEVLAEGYLGPNSKVTQSFEKELEDYLGMDRNVLALNSGTAALHLALKVLGIGRGDIVLVQSFSFCAPAFAVTYTGAKPVFIDSEKESWNMCPDALEEALDYYNGMDLMDKVKAIIVVHAYGTMANMEAILSLSKEYGIPLIEDAAEAIGATYNGRMAGTWGDIAIISFNANKTLSTGGGGALININKELHKRAAYFANQAKGASPYYKHDAIGYNYAIGSLPAAIGSAQLRSIEDLLQDRKERFDSYEKLFQTHKVIQSQRDLEGGNSSRWLSAFQSFEAKINYKSLSQLNPNLEIRPVFKPLHLQGVYRKASYFGGDNAESIFNRGFVLPSGKGSEAVDWVTIFD